MILEEIVKQILKEDMPKLENIVKWDGMYDEISNKIVKQIKKELVK